MPDNHERATAVLLQVAENANLDASARVRACELILGRPLTLSEDSDGKAAALTPAETERADRAERVRLAHAASGGLVKRLPVA